MKECVRIVMTVLCLFAVQVEAKEFAFDFSLQGMGDASAPVCSFAVGDRINLSLPDGQPSFALEIVSAPPPGIAGQSFIATDAATGASAIIKPAADGLRITVDDFAGNNIHSFRIKDGVKSYSMRGKSAEPDGCATCAGLACTGGLDDAAGVTGARSLKAMRLASSGDTFPLAEQKKVVDILVAFDCGAKAWAESANWPDGDTIEEFADYAIAKMNYVLEMSQLLDRFCYRLVGVVEVDATFPKIENSVLLELSAGSGAFAPVAAMREKCGADTTTLLVNRTSGTTSGIGFPLQSTNDNAFAAFAAANKNCNVCDINTVASRYTMSHETGHNMGCGHSNTQGANSGPETGPFPYSCGYHFTANGLRYHTVMAYQYDGSGNRDYIAVPYFSSPDITPDDLGVPLGVEGVNDNRQVLAHTHKGVETYREHVLPYAWDVRFLDDNGNDIPSGTYFSPRLYVTFTHANPNATIYYTYDGSAPTTHSASCAPGTRFTLNGTRTITACAVVDGVAQSMRTVTFVEGLSWSGEPGMDGDGVWTSADSSVLAWNGSSSYFLSGYDTVEFPDLDCNAAPIVTVRGVVSPAGASFPASVTAYAFVPGTTDASIHLPDASFAPSGDLTFNLPVRLDATAFTNPANHTLTFNAPFGQTVTETEGCCTNMIGIGAYGPLAVSPGAGKTQTFGCFNNVGWFYNNAQIRIGAGTVVFKGPVSDRGLFGSTKMDIAGDGRVVLDMASAAYNPFYTSVVSGEGTVEYRALLPVGSQWSDSSWKGTVLLTNISAKTLALDLYGNSGSTVRLSGVSGYPGASSNTNMVFDTTIELVDTADGVAAWTVDNGYSTDCTHISRLAGNGTLKTTLSNVKQGFTIGDASRFTGSLDIAGAQFTFGETIRKNGTSQNGTIYIDAGQSITNAAGASWSAPNLAVYGELVKRGTLTAANSIVFGAGASLVTDTLPADGVVLTSKSIVTNGVVHVAVVGDGNSYVASVVNNGDATCSLVFTKAPLPETVPVPLTLRHWNDDAGKFEDKAFTFDLPVGWATNRYPSLGTADMVAAKYNDTAANGAKVWQCYMLGLDPTNQASRISLVMTVEGNTIRFAVNGLGETHPIDGVSVNWAMKTSTNLVADAGFTMTRDTAQGLSPAFAAHPMPDKPTPYAAATSDTLFYKITVAFVAEDNESEQP